MGGSILRDSRFSRLASRLEEALGRRVKVLQEELSQSSVSGSFPLDRGCRLWVEGELTEQEKALVHLFLEEWRQNWLRASDSAEPPAILERWLQLTELCGEASPPPLSVEELFREERVPFLVVHPVLSRERMSSLKKVVNSYFEGRAWLVPLDGGESLLLLPLSFIHGEGPQRWERGLEEAAWGLAEVITTEAGEDVKVVVHPGIHEAHLLPRAIAALRDTWRLGRIYLPGDPAYTTWGFSLEKLLESLDEEVVKQYLADLSKSPFWEDEELCRTLETFLEQDLNVSEAARRLFIHRNTLIYRLERLKQETGLDARRFEDAFRIRLVLRLSHRCRSWADCRAVGEPSSG